MNEDDADKVICWGDNDDPLPKFTSEQWARVVEARKERGRVLDASEVLEILKDLPEHQTPSQS